MFKNRLFLIALLCCGVQLVSAQKLVSQPEPASSYTIEFWRKGNAPRELSVGNYVVVAQTTSEVDARKLAKEFKKLKHPEPIYGYQTNKGFWLVCLKVECDIPELKTSLDRFRTYSLYKAAWLLAVHE